MPALVVDTSGLMSVQDIAQLLGKLQTQGGFATHFTVPVDDLHLEVRDLGKIVLPVSAFVARELCNRAQLACHGYKDQTRVDTRVRNTWEIPADSLRIDAARWQRTLVPALNRIGGELGLAKDCRLSAELHNLLIYEAGQFFAPHQDSEKTDGMIGTLVVTLPSAYTGGRFVIEHRGHTLRVGGSAKKLGFTAFYADCHHEAKPVKTGYRIVLTYNLIVENPAPHASPTTPDPLLDDLTASVRRFFDTPSPPRWGGALTEPPPDRLVYLLDHQYTQSGMDWNRLKSVDALRVAALKEAANRLDCDMALALVEVRESWQCEDEEYGPYSNRRWDYGDEEDDEDEDEDANRDGDYVLVELIDNEIELRHAIGPDGSPADVMGAFVDGNELVLTRPSEDFEPFQAEYEGYMGNYGNTLDRWYHRAALVLWPRERVFVMAAKASPSWALEQIAGCVDRSDMKQARALASRLLPFWQKEEHALNKPTVAQAILHAAALLDDADTADALLAPLNLDALPPEAIPSLMRLLKQHGTPWLECVLGRMLEKQSESWETAEHLSWLASTLVPLCQAFCDIRTADVRSLAERVLVARWHWLHDHARTATQRARSRDLPDLLASLRDPALAIFQACHIVGHDTIHAQALALLTSPTDGLPVTAAIDVLRAAHASGASCRHLGLAPLHQHAKQVLGTCLAQPERTADDWSIPTRLGCSCALCVSFSTFLTSRTETHQDWPLAEPKRKHIEQIIDMRDLPVSHTTVRQGRPYRLVLKKSHALFQRSSIERARWAADATWLASVGDAFADPANR